MSQEIINVLNYIGEKIGIAIDWTADNVLPQVMDILGRYRTFQIVGFSMCLIIFVVLAFVFVRCAKPFISNYRSCSNNRDENLWFEYSSYWSEIKWKAPSYIYIICLAIYLVFAVISTPIITSELLKWIFVPELQYLDMLRGYIQ